MLDTIYCGLYLWFKFCWIEPINQAVHIYKKIFHVRNQIVHELVKFKLGNADHSLMTDFVLKTNLCLGREDFNTQS